MLNRSTLRLHALALAVASWIVVAWTQMAPGLFDRFGTLRGVDFLQFYAAGWFVATGRTGQLYDWDAFARALPALVPGIGDLLFLPVYPPQVALMFAPLARFPYGVALACWTVVSVACYAAAIGLMVRCLPAVRAYRLEAWSFALGFPAFVQLIAHGQIAALGVLLLAAAFAAFRSDRPLLLGLALGSLVFKPQLGTLAAASLLLCPSWRLCVGLGLGAGVQLGLAVVLLDLDALRDYAGVAMRVLAMPGAFEPKLWAMHSLRGAVELLLGQTRLATALWIVGVVFVGWAARRAWARQPSLEARFAVLALTGLLWNPHLYVYDLVLLGVPLACLASGMIRAGQAPGRSAELSYALVWLPLIGPLARVTHVQLTAVVMVLLLVELSRGPAMGGRAC